METSEKHLENLQQVRALMEQSSRFLSLSGLSGIFAGIYALIGFAVVAWYMDFKILFPYKSEKIIFADGTYNQEFILFALLIAVAVLTMAIGTSLFVSWKKSKRKNLIFWSSSTIKLGFNLFLPLAIGGIFASAQLYHGHVGTIASTTLLFYGIALIGASKFTFNDIKYLGYLQVVLGIFAAFFIGYGLILWAVGFGILHILYGIIMYFKYDKQ